MTEWNFYRDGAIVRITENAARHELDAWRLRSCDRGMSMLLHDQMWSEIDRLRATLAERDTEITTLRANALDLSAVPEGFGWTLTQNSGEPVNAVVDKGYGSGRPFFNAYGPTPAAALSSAIERAKEAIKGSQHAVVHIRADASRTTCTVETAKSDAELRAEKIVAAREAGETLERIGQRFSLTRERIRQILKKTRPDLRVRELRGRCKRVTYSVELIEVARDLWHAEDAHGAPLLRCVEISDTMSIGLNALIGLAHRNHFRKRLSGHVMAWA